MSIRKMLTFDEAIKKGGWQIKYGCLVFPFGDGYELVLEPCLFDGQMYLALYRNEQLVGGFEKVVVRKGYEKKK